MPTYDYKCTACGNTLEIFQSMKDKPLKKCPKCGKAKLERLIGMGAAVIFKGSGFYQTDYRSEAYKKSADSDKAPAATETTKTESTPATKPEPAAAAKTETPKKAESAPEKPAAKSSDGKKPKPGKKS